LENAYHGNLRKIVLTQIEPFPAGDIVIDDDDENKRCPVFPVYAYWSNFYNNSVYIPHNQTPPRKFKSYHLFTHVFSLSQCKEEDSIALFQCRVNKNYNYFSSFLSISPEIECTQNTGYPRKEKIGHCFAEKTDAEGLVPLHKYYHAALDAHFYTSDKDDVDLDECEYEGIMCYVYPSEQKEQGLFSSVPSAVTETKDLLKVAEQVPQSPIDIIIMLDSSGSVADEDFSNWQAEIDYAAATIDAWVDSEFVIPGSSIGLINYSGCGPKTTFEECQKQNKLKLEWGLAATKEEMLARLDSMGPADFNYGYTWNDEALSIALAEFEASSTGSIVHERWIILLAAGDPSRGYEACKTSADYISETVVALKELGVNFYTVAISMTQDTMDEYFGCLGDVYGKDSFDNLYDIEE